MAGRTSPRRDLGLMLAASVKRLKPPPSLLNKIVNGNNTRWNVGKYCTSIASEM